MISRIPSLDLLSDLTGLYRTADGFVELHLERLGHGASVTLRANSKTELSGVVGAADRTDLECYAQVGLPNIVRLSSHQPSDAALTFTSGDIPLELLFVRDGDEANLTVKLGPAKGNYLMRRATLA